MAADRRRVGRADGVPGLAAAIAASHTIGADTADRASPGTATKWIRTRTTSPTLTETLDLRDAIHVGHSTGGGEVARYLGRHGTSRVAKAVLIGAVPPLMLKTPANPGGLPIDAFDQIRAGVAADRSQFFKDLTMPFYGYNRPGAKVSEGVRDSFWLQGMMAGHKSALDCIKAFSETDFTEDLKKIDVPTLIMHGDDDQIVPIGASAMQSAKLIKNNTLKVYKGFAARHVHHQCRRNQSGPARVHQNLAGQGGVVPASRGYNSDRAWARPIVATPDEQARPRWILRRPPRRHA